VCSTPILFISILCTLRISEFRIH